MLENRGLRVKTVGTGRVQRQSLAAGSALKRGTTVVLELAPIGRQMVPVILPSVAAEAKEGRETPTKKRSVPSSLTQQTPRRTESKPKA